MKVIGITGGVGSGKSAVLDYMEEEYGAYILKADELAAKLKEPGNVCYEPLVALLGESAMTGTSPQEIASSQVMASISTSAGCTYRSELLIT